MVLLHERHMRSFLETWKRAKASGVQLPVSDDPSYASMETLLRHVLRAAGGYMIWMCERLELGDPQVEAAPVLDAVEAEADDYLEHVLQRWTEPLADVPEETFYRPEHPSRWKTLYCIDAMLEHAVMHPIRHEHQLRTLMGE